MESLGIIAIILVVLLGICALSIVMYIFESLALFSIAKRRRIRACGLAWVPVANCWILGSIADGYDIATKGKSMSFKHILLWGEVGLAAFAFVSSFVEMVAVFSNAFELAMYGGQFNPFIIGPNIVGAETLMTIGILGWIIIPFVIAFDVFIYMALYRIYASCNPDAKVTLFVLSIIFPVIIPFVLFVNRKKDDGFAISLQEKPSVEQE